MRDDATMRDDSPSVILENNSILSSQSRVSHHLDRCKAMLAKLEQELAEEENEDGADFWATKLGLTREMPNIETHEEVRQETAETLDDQNTTERRDDDLKHKPSLTKLLERDRSHKSSASKDDKSVSSKRSVASQLSKALSFSSNASLLNEIAKLGSSPYEKLGAANDIDVDTAVEAPGHSVESMDPPAKLEPIESPEPHPNTAYDLEPEQDNDVFPEATSTVDQDNLDKKKSSFKKKNSFMKSLAKTLSLKNMGRENKKQQQRHHIQENMYDSRSHEFSIATADPVMTSQGCAEDLVLSARSADEAIEDKSDREISRSPLKAVANESRDDEKLSDEVEPSAVGNSPSPEGTKLLDAPIDTLLGIPSNSKWSDDEALPKKCNDQSLVGEGRNSSANAHGTNEEAAPSEENHADKTVVEDMREGAELLEEDSIRHEGVKMLEENSKQIFQKFESLKSVLAEWHVEIVSREPQDEAANHLDNVSPTAKDEAADQIKAPGTNDGDLATTDMAEGGDKQLQTSVHTVGLQIEEPEDKADPTSSRVQEPTEQEVKSTPVPERMKTSQDEIAQEAKSTRTQVSAGDDTTVKSTREEVTSVIKAVFSGKSPVPERRKTSQSEMAQDAKSTRTQVSAGDDITVKSTREEVASVIKAVLTGKSKTRKANKYQVLQEESGSDPNVGPKESEKIAVQRVENDFAEEMLDQVTELQEINFEVPAYRQSKKYSKLLRKQEKLAKKERKKEKKLEKERKKLEKERKKSEKKKLEAEMLEKKKLEAEMLEKKKLEAEMLEKKKLEAEKLEKEAAIDSGLPVSIKKSDHSNTLIFANNHHPVKVKSPITNAGDDEQSIADVLSIGTDKSEQPIDDGLGVSEQKEETLDKSEGKVDVRPADRWKKQFRKTLSWSEDVDLIEEKKEEESERAAHDVQAVIWWSNSKDAVEVMYEDEDDEKSTSSDYHSTEGDSSYGTDNSFATEPHIDFSFSTLKDAFVEEAAFIKDEVRDEIYETASEYKKKATNYFVKEIPNALSLLFTGKKKKEIKVGNIKMSKTKKKTKNHTTTSSKKTRGVIKNPNQVGSW